MSDLDLFIVAAALAMGGFTFLRLLAAAREAAVAAALMGDKSGTPSGKAGGDSDG
jgi:hypothetical protein